MKRTTRTKTSGGGQKRFADVDLTAKLKRTRIPYEDVVGSFRNYEDEEKQNIFEWIRQFDALCETACWDEFDKVTNLIKSLDENVKELMMTVDRKYETVKAMLLERYGWNWTPGRALRRMMVRRRTETETIRDYIMDMRRLGRAAKLDEETIVQFVVDGTQYDDMTQWFLRRAINFREVREGMEYADRKRERETTTHDAVVQAEHDEDDGVDVMQYEATDGKRRQRCVNCGDKSHGTDYCPDKTRGRKCFNCNEYGHLSVRCREKDINGECVEAVTVKNDRGGTGYGSRAVNDSRRYAIGMITTQANDDHRVETAGRSALDAEDGAEFNDSVGDEYEDDEAIGDVSVAGVTSKEAKATSVKRGEEQKGADGTKIGVIVTQKSVDGGSVIDGSCEDELERDEQEARMSEVNEMRANKRRCGMEDWLEQAEPKVIDTELAASADCSDERHSDGGDEHEKAARMDVGDVMMVEEVRGHGLSYARSDEDEQDGVGTKMKEERWAKIVRSSPDDERLNSSSGSEGRMAGEVRERHMGREADVNQSEANVVMDELEVYVAEDDGCSECSRKEKYERGAEVARVIAQDDSCGSTTGNRVEGYELDDRGDEGVDGSSKEQPRNTAGTIEENSVLKRQVRSNDESRSASVRRRSMRLTRRDHGKSIGTGRYHESEQRWKMFKRRKSRARGDEQGARRVAAAG